MNHKTSDAQFIYDRSWMSRREASTQVERSQYPAPMYVASA
jgi:hypothetical protein